MRLTRFIIIWKTFISIKYNNLNRISTVCKSLNESITVAGLNTILYEGSYRYKVFIWNWIKYITATFMSSFMFVIVLNCTNWQRSPGKWLFSAIISQNEKIPNLSSVCSYPWGCSYKKFRQLKNIKFVCGSCAACWQSQLMVEDKVRPQAGPKSQQVTMLVVVESITIEIPVLLDKITFNISYYTM